MEKEINLIFPHQLFQNSELLTNGRPIYLIEEHLFFRQFKFHKQKLAYHRATLKSYESLLKEKDLEVHYISTTDQRSDIRILLEKIIHGTTINLIDPTDNWLEKRILKFSHKLNINFLNSQLFINSKKDNASFFRKDKKSFFQSSFYKQQRRRLNILIDEHNEPLGGKWSYDADNRKKYPKGKTPPTIQFPDTSPYWIEAIDYINKNFGDNPGSLSEKQLYPIDHRTSLSWLQQFLEKRFYDFGVYEDAILKDDAYLHHSVLSPMLNIGLISAHTVIEKAITYSTENDIPINTIEGFVRQIIGWREFIRGMYEIKGSYSRTKNHWNFTKKIPQSFYSGTTGILPIDVVIKQVLQTGYCHHIERLMVLGSFMLLCEFDPDEVYKWFMELFIDAYDWVMVPNVYGMSQFSDGGTFATKPYISGSNYIKKMSNYPNGEWQVIWDGLFWRFLHVYRETFVKNPRTSMLLRTLDKMTDEKRSAHLAAANAFLDGL